MNLEKALSFAMLAFAAWTGAYLGLMPATPAAFGDLTVQGGVPLKADFNLGAVIDNTPFSVYYAPARRNPFVPFQPPAAGAPTAVQPVSSQFDFPRPQPVSAVPLIDLPAKPGTEPAEKIDPAQARKDESLPVYLVGFARLGEGTDTDRKAILADKQSGAVYTAREGDVILGLIVARITPCSVIIVMPNGRRVEFLHDILKEQP
ncbi:MAG: hypothetical protein ABIF71_08160 [Planctomycetota bacterium]